MEMESLPELDTMPTYECLDATAQELVRRADAALRSMGSWERARPLLQDVARVLCEHEIARLERAVRALARRDPTFADVPEISDVQTNGPGGFMWSLVLLEDPSVREEDYESEESLLRHLAAENFVSGSSGSGKLDISLLERIVELAERSAAGGA
jgi:hypothetical protein